MDSENNTILSHFCWSNEIIIITLISLFFIVAAILLIPVFAKGSVAEICRYIVVPLCIIVIWLSISFTPRYLSIDSKCIKLQRIVGTIEIPLTTVYSIDIVSSAMIKGSIRLFGSGGFFGYLGIFRNKNIGQYTMYATELKHLIMVKTTHKTYVFSCRNGETFKTFLKSSASR
ncbi:MAG: PH domain-containing protein [Bacteroidales bacterium]|nr:PH domain-containing protein [Bacteroidales bacterium]